jgi:threonine dehydratase
MMLSPSAPTLDDIQRARHRLLAYLPPTPLRHYAPLDQAVGLRVLVKHENHQPTNSFKIRNGLAAMTALSPARRKQGVIAASTGNHGAGVALAGQLLHVPVTICVPMGNNPEKNEAMRGLGAQVIEEGQTYDDAIAVMQRLATHRGLHAIHSTDNADVVAGAGTMALEILEQAEALHERLDAIVFAVGGGSQAAGAITVLRQLRPEIEVYGVQAAGASAIYESWRARCPLQKSTVCTFAEGIATRSAYAMTFPTLCQGLRDFVLATDADLADAVRLLLKTTHNLAEGAGAAGLAGLRKLAPQLQNKTVAIVLSGSNLDQQTLADILSLRL